MSKKAGHYEIYRSRNKEFRWRFIKNGRKIFASTEGYKTRLGITKSLACVKNAMLVDVIDLTRKK